jgi:hypothetical protein
MATLNVITNNTGYLTFDIYNQATGVKMSTWDIPKINITAIITHYNASSNEGLGMVVINTISQIDQSNKNNSIIELVPASWALAATPTVAIIDAATLHTTLIGYCSPKW